MWNKLFTFIGYLLFGLILLIPYKLQFVKLGFALILLLPYIVKFCRKEFFYVNKQIFTWVYLFVFMGLFYIIYALVKGNPAPMLYFPVYVLWPVLFFFLIVLVDYKMYLNLLSCMRNAFTIISILGIYAFIRFNVTLGLEREFFVFTSTVRPGFPFLAIASGTITNMIYLYVFFWSLYILDKSKLKKQDKLNLILGFIFIFASSRRAIFMILAVSVLFSIFVAYIFQSENRMLYTKSVKNFIGVVAFWVTIIIIVVVQLDLFNFELLWEFIGNAVGSDSAGVGYDPRLLQFDALIDGWLNFPMLGNATGIDASVIRSDIPGTYELSYIALLFERGIIGTFIYALQFVILNIWLIASFRKGQISSSYGLATLVAFDMFMVANATNPYLGAFDHLWVLFMVLVIININNKPDEKYLCHNTGL